MHAADIIHGDVKPDNFLLRLEPNFKHDENAGVPWTCAYDVTGGNGWQHRGLTCIDFGSSVDMRLLDADTQLRTSWKQERGRKAGSEVTLFDDRLKYKWRYDIDLVGVAGCVHVILFGKYWSIEQPKDTAAEWPK